LLGSTRKLLGLTFQGETRDADGMVWGDVDIKGLTSDVSPIPSLYSSCDPDHMKPSTGTFGANPDFSRKLLNFLYYTVSKQCMDFCRIMARPLSPDGNTFGVGITAQNFDPTHLAEPVAIKEFIHTETGRTDLQFGEFTWLSYFKYVLGLVESTCFQSTCLYRPNMRMVNKFQEGRAFVVGGEHHKVFGGNHVSQSWF
jgi:hypothetical protein